MLTNIDKNGDYKRKRVLQICKEHRADILRQLLESPNLKIIGGFGHGWEMITSQHQLVDEIYDLLDLNHRE